MRTKFDHSWPLIMFDLRVVSTKLPEKYVKTTLLRIYMSLQSLHLKLYKATIKLMNREGRIEFLVTHRILTCVASFSIMFLYLIIICRSS